MKTFKLPLIMLFFLLVGCKKDSENNETDTYQISLLKKTWEHSYEELHNIYRPSDYMDFPASRYRQSFTFKDDNVCYYSVLAPDDRHYEEEGKWKFDPKTKVLEMTNSKSVILYKFKIIKLTENILEIKGMLHI